MTLPVTATCKWLLVKATLFSSDATQDYSEGDYSEGDMAISQPSGNLE